MRAVLQRVKESKVEVEGKVLGHIGQGLLIFLAVANEDTEEDAKYLVEKIVHLRVFDDEKGRMNISSLEKKSAFLVVSQFTLLADCRKGRRPSFDKAAAPNKAESLYDNFVMRLKEYHLPVETGEFRAMMNVHLINDGPVTFIVDTR